MVPLDAAARRQDEIQIVPYRGRQGTQPLLLLFRRPPAILRLALGLRHPFRAEQPVLHPVGGQGILRHTLAVLVDLQAVAVFQHLDVPALASPLLAFWRTRNPRSEEHTS